jgi:DNA topoisomerase-2
MSSTDIALANKYQQKTDKQHILDNPDTYIGSVEEVDSNLWVVNDSTGNVNGNKIIEKNIKCIPGLFKLFDEGIVNCRDHVVRMNQAIASGVVNSLPVSYIDISIQDDGTIIMINDGNGIDVAQHPEYKIWIPELIFGHLRTSTNYDKTEKKISNAQKTEPPNICVDKTENRYPTHPTKEKENVPPKGIRGMKNQFTVMAGGR